jgi:cytochrome c553
MALIRRATVVPALVVATGLLFAQSAGAQSAAPQGDIAKGRAIAEQVCWKCHGVDGRGLRPKYPSLAGQYVNYIVKQLTRFQSGEREHFIMGDITSRLSPEAMRDVAAYMNAQPPIAAKAARPATPAAQALYRTGRPADGLPACQTCHGPRGLGAPEFPYPRIAGQHGEYVLRQLRALKSSERAVEAGNPMHDVASKLSEQEMEDLANLVEGLN